MTVYILYIFGHNEQISTFVPKKQTKNLTDSKFINLIHRRDNFSQWTVSKKNLFKTRKDQLHFWPRLVQTTTWFYLFGRNSISIYEYLLWLFFNFLGIIFQPKFRSRTLCCIFGFSQNFMFSDTTRMSGQWALNVLHCLRQTFSLTGCPVSIPAVPVPLLHPSALHGGPSSS